MGWSSASPSISPSTDCFFASMHTAMGKRFMVKADDLLTAFLSLEKDAIAPKGANGKGHNPAFSANKLDNR